MKKSYFISVTGFLALFFFFATRNQITTKMIVDRNTAPITAATIIPPSPDKWWKYDSLDLNSNKVWILLNVSNYTRVSNAFFKYLDSV